MRGEVPARIIAELIAEPDGLGVEALADRIHEERKWVWRNLDALEFSGVVVKDRSKDRGEVWKLSGRLSGAIAKTVSTAREIPVERLARRVARTVARDGV
jgi:hypothetical protein